MKKIALLVLPLVLAACDKSPTVVSLQTCGGWEEKIGTVVEFGIWDDGRAVLRANGSDIDMGKGAEKGNAVVWWNAVLPETNEEFFIAGTYDAKSKAFVDFDIVSGQTEEVWGTITDTKILVPVKFDVQ